MHPNTLGKIIAVLIVLFSLTVSGASAASADERRESIRSASTQTLDRLYRIHPSARGAIEKAAGYAVFNITDANIIYLGGGGGNGLAVNNATGAETFMKTGDIQVGLGLGIKKFAVVFVFETEKSFADFINNGWEFSGQTTVAAKDTVNGGSLQGAVAVDRNVWMYQLTEKGLEASLTLRGIRYFKDGDLN